MTSHATENGGASKGGSGPATAGVDTLESQQHSFTILGIGGRRLAAVLLGWFFVVFDGYDLIVYGTVQSALANEWGLGSAQLGTIGSMAFFGMAIGAVFIGRLSDRLGRKAAVIGSVVILSVFTLLCAFAPNPWVFGAFRFIAGLGLGGLVPSVNAMVSDLVPRRTMSAWATVMMSGVPLGGSIAAVLAGPIVTSSEEWGWRLMFLLALVPLV
ncbi:MAG: aromatic acid/H+ symport family MFS transporter, partial [Corynebacterium sp.]|nr:aromatic acid/H+ symport family MFS transporter [Corynebacterium sp.]